MTSVHEKLIFGAIVAAATGKPVNLNFSGTKKQIAVMQEVVSCLKQVNDTINEERTTMAKVISALQRKHEIVKKFEECFGLKWPSNL